MYTKGLFQVRVVMLRNNQLFVCKSSISEEKVCSEKKLNLGMFTKRAKALFLKRNGSDVSILVGFISSNSQMLLLSHKHEYYVGTSVVTINNLR